MDKAYNPDQPRDDDGRFGSGGRGRGGSHEQAAAESRAAAADALEEGDAHETRAGEVTVRIEGQDQDNGFTRDTVIVRRGNRELSRQPFIGQRQVALDTYETAIVAHRSGRGNRGGNGGAVRKTDFERTVPIAKRDDEQQIAWGWAYVCEEGDCPVVDHSGDVVDALEVQKAAHGFVRESRVGGVLHQSSAGEIVDSIFFSRELQKALGIDLGKVGWLIGYQVHDPAVWEGVKSGKYSAFSIGGTAETEPIDKAYNPDQPRDDDGRFGSGGGGGGGDRTYEIDPQQQEAARRAEAARLRQQQRERPRTRAGNAHLDDRAVERDRARRRAGRIEGPGRRDPGAAIRPNHPKR